jgi:outer membrane immunogenic protein
MKKLVLTLAAIAAFTAPAFAADMAPRYTKAPPAPVAYAPSWTGCYVGGGGGYGIWNQDNTTFLDGPPRTLAQAEHTDGGRGYFGTVQGGCDYQFGLAGYNLVVGAFGDYDFSSLKGEMMVGTAEVAEKMSSAWSVGGRAGWLVTPSLLTYFSAGYTQATFDQTNFTPFGFAVPNFFINKQTYNGYFIGAGDEYALNFLPGLFWKTEYRYAQYDKERLSQVCIATSCGPLGSSTGTFYDSEKHIQTIRTELVYRFNWGGPLVAKY